MFLTSRDRDQAHLDARKGFSLEDFQTTEDIIIPKDPLERVVGQDNAIELAKIAARQRRHLLLVGPPGTGKSMIGQALSLHLPRPTEETQVVHNPESPERPFVEVKTADIVYREREQLESAAGEVLDPKEAPINVAEKLGFKCQHCGAYSSPDEVLCPKCNKGKMASGQGQTANQPFGDLFGNLGNLLEVTVRGMSREQRVTTTRKRLGKEEVVVYERYGSMIKVLDEKALEKRHEIEKLSPRKVIVNIERNPFVMATGASETELLGDVKHDPYGGHPQLGTPPYERVVPGAIHEAHQGVLFIDELPHLGHLQHFILTAMQEKRFPITGRNPQSAGASVKVDNVPCDFIFVGACNIQDLAEIISPLRSRIIGAGYELLVNTFMEDNDRNTTMLAQFAAQEIAMDGRVPPASQEAVVAIIDEARKRAKKIDGADRALTLRLRELGGLIRTSGDIAVTEENPLIEARHVKAALERAKTLEEQIEDRYGSYSGGVATDVTGAQKAKSPYLYWNKHVHDDRSGYG